MNRSELERELERLHADSWGWALACCGRDRELAEDVLQTAYLRMLSGSAAFAGRSNLKTWVFGVIRLTAMSESRRRRIWGSRGATDDEVMDAPDPAAGPDTAAEDSEQRAVLIAALAAIAPRQREVLELVFYHGMTIEDAAAVMKVSIGTARTHYDRAKKALAQQLMNKDPR